MIPDVMNAPCGSMEWRGTASSRMHASAAIQQCIRHPAAFAPQTSELHILHHAGGPEGIKAMASKMITQHQLDDTFYIVDLANVVRLYKVWCVSLVVGSGRCRHR